MLFLCLERIVRSVSDISTLETKGCLTASVVQCILEWLAKNNPNEDVNILCPALMSIALQYSKNKDPDETMKRKFNDQILGYTVGLDMLSGAKFLLPICSNFHWMLLEIVVLEKTTETAK